MGLYLEDFEINRTRQTRGRTIGEGDVSLFAGLVGDHNPLHVDEEFSQQEHFRRPRRARAAGAFDRDRPDVAAQLDRRHGARPARRVLGIPRAGEVGDTISARVTPLEARPSKTPERGILKIGFEVLNQHDEVVQVGSIVLLMRRRPQQAQLIPSRKRETGDNRMATLTSTIDPRSGHFGQRGGL